MQADQKKILRLLKTSKGQIEGIIKMVEDDRYCIDVSNQLLAAMAILRTVNKDILTAHLHGCVKNALQDSASEDVVDEIVTIIDKLSK